MKFFNGNLKKKIHFLNLNELPFVNNFDWALGVCLKADEHRKNE